MAQYPASQEIGIDFDWLDKRSMDPVGYKRVNKRTGKEASEIRALDELKLPAAGKTAAGLKMAKQLISDMTGPWDAPAYTDRFSAAVQALVSQKVAAGQTAAVTPLEVLPSKAGTGNVVDLTELLSASLAKRKPVSAAGRGNGRGPVAARKPAATSPRASDTKAG